MFHGVQDEPLSPACWHVLDAATYRRQLEYIRQHFNVLPLEEALEALAAGTLPPRAMAITFDDGTRNLATHAVPVLRELGLPAAVFLATGPMDSDETLWPDRLWLAIARTTATEADLNALGLGTRSLDGTANRGKVYAAAVERFKDCPTRNGSRCWTRSSARWTTATATVVRSGCCPGMKPGRWSVTAW